MVEVRSRCGFGFRSVLKHNTKTIYRYGVYTLHNNNIMVVCVWARRNCGDDSLYHETRKVDVKKKNTIKQPLYAAVWVGVFDVNPTAKNGVTGHCHRPNSHAIRPPPSRILPSSGEGGSRLLGRVVRHSIIVR